MKPERIYQALSDRNRLRILKMLEVRPLCVCEITSVLDLATSTVSRHLAMLRDAGFVVDNKDGKWMYYALNKNSEDKEIRELLGLTSRWLSGDETVASDFKKAKTVDKEKLCGA